jgi:hypothetical protein
MAKYEFDKNKFEEWKRAQKESAEIQEKMNSSLSGYFETMKKIGELQKNIQHIESKRNELADEYGRSAKDVRDNWAKLIEARKRGDADEIKALKDKDKELRKILAAKKEGLKITEAELKLIKEQTAELTESAKQASLMSAGLSSAVGFLGKTPGLIAKGFGMLRGTGIFEMDKEIRNAVRSMAGGQKQYNNMLGTIQKAAETTTMWGVGVKDLAIMQRGYSEAIGRSVMLTQEGYKSMAKLAEGTGLGKEFAVQIAGEMDKFNISAERTSTIVEDTMNTAAKIGVNAAAALKSMQNNLKLAQRFNFKGGIAGLAKLSAEATKLKLDMEGIAGMAERVFRPEGAIEMAAELTTMGGQFAALGDPMQLMFKARNDFEGFAKDIGKASAEFVEFNKETGEFNIKNGLAADRMREISRITGISVEKLQEMAEAQARISEINKSVKSGMFNEEDTALISSMAKFDEKKGGWVINVDGQDKMLKDLRKTDMDRIKAEKETLDKRAEDARTFDETVQDLILMFKQQLLPLAQQLKDGLGGPIQAMVKQWSQNGFFQTLRDFVTKAGELAVWLGKWIVKAAEWLGPTGTLAVILGGKVLFEAAKWFMNGMIMGRGFMSVAGGMGGMGGGGMMDMAGGGKGGRFSRFMRGGAKGGLRRNMLAGSARFGRTGAGRLMGGAGRALGGAGRFLGGAAGGGLLAAGFSGYDEWSENSAMGMSTGENVGRTAAKAGGAGLGAWGGAAAGAAIGSVVPIVGTAIGGLIGGIVGGIAGSSLGESIGDFFYGSEREPLEMSNSAIGSNQAFDTSTLVNDGIIFHPQDKFMKVNDATMIAGTQAGGNAKLASALTGGGGGETHHTFSDLNIKVQVTAPTDEKFWREIFNSPELMRRLTEEVHISTEAAASGKISGSPKRRNSKS